MSSPLLNPRFTLPGEPASREKGSAVAIRLPARIADRKHSRFGDIAFRVLVIACALSIFIIVGLILFELIQKSTLSLKAFGWRFFIGENWDPVQGEFGALPFIYGTLVSSFLALLIAVPLGVGVAVFTTEMCPRWLRAPLSFTVELLAAIPSVIYGLWGIFVLAPLLRNYVQPWLARHFGWTRLFEGPPYGIGMLAAGVILAIMVIPFISSITREVMSAVPRH